MISFQDELLNLKEELSGENYKEIFIATNDNQHDKKELRFNQNDSSKRVMFLIKEYLLLNDYVTVTCGSIGSPALIRAAESLVRLGYVKYDKVQTDTTVLNGKRRTKLIVKLSRTDNFKALHDENEMIRKRTQEIDNTP